MARTLRGEVLVSIDAPHFNAGIVALDGVVVKTAPILKYMVGWDGRKVAQYCDRRGWKWSLVRPSRPPGDA